MKGFVYILRLDNGNYYIGSTNSLERRIGEHKGGREKYTSKFLPIDLVFSQEYESLKMARNIERKLKKLKRKDIIERIISDGKIRMSGC